MPVSEDATPVLRDVSIVSVVAQSKVLFDEDFDTEGLDAPGVGLQILSNEPDDLLSFGVKLEIAHATPDMRIAVQAVAHYEGTVPEFGGAGLAELMEESALPALFPFVYETFRSAAARLPGEQPSIPATRPHFSLTQPSDD